MNIGQHFLEALESLAANKLRSALTMLGIIIGVASVISMIAVGVGAQASVNNSINSLGTNLIFVSSGARGVTNPQPITLADLAAISDPSQAPDVQAAAATLSGRSTIAYGSQSSEGTSVIAVTPVYASLRNLVVAEGSFLSDTEESGRTAVAVIGPTTADNLFGRHTDVVGMTIRLSGQPFRVIGVLESKGGGGLGSQDDQVLIPLSTGQSRLFHRASRNNIDQILVQATSSSTVTAASNEVTQILTTRHHLGAKPADFTLLTQQDILSSASSITQIFTIFLGGIGGISLLVGGIGIMNIMLVSVTERTREIGLRKALGARRIDILAQFLVESLVLSLIGGAIGVGAAWGISALIGKLAASSGTAITPVINLNTILLATLFSAAIGLFFGIYPANRAAGLEPVEALRYE